MLKQKRKKIILGVCAVVVAIAGPLQLSQTASADRFDDQMRAIRAQMQQLQARASELRKQGDTLQSALDTLTAEKNAIQAQMDLNQAKYDKLTADIELNKQKLADNQAALGGIIASLYVDDEVSPLEMLASSQNVSDFMDKQEFRSAASERLNSTIDTVKTLKAQLESDQKAVEKVLEDQKAQAAALVAKEAEQQDLVNQTRGEEAAYQQQVASSKAQLSQVAAQQRAALAAATNGGRNNSGKVGSFQFRNFSGNQGCSGGYPWCYGLDNGYDEFRLYHQECVSYAAWAAYYRFNKRVLSFNGAGHAYQWPSTTVRMGATTDRNPAVGSIAVTPQSAFTPLGHVMVVEAIIDDEWVHVSQFNFGGTGEYSTMDVHVSSVNFVHFSDR